MQLEDGSIQHHDTRRDHVLRKPLEKAISGVVGDDPKIIVEAVLVALDEQRVISYASRDTLAFLTPAARVLVIVAENPFVTLREISVVLGVTESSVAKSLAKLVAANVIARTKVGGRNVYKVRAETLKEHPDICRYNDAISRVFLEGDATPVDSSAENVDFSADSNFDKGLAN